MIDRERGHNENGFWSKASRGMEDFRELSGISNKTMVSLVIFALIVVLCIVYVFEIRGGRKADSAADAATAVTSAAPAVEPPADEAAEPAQEAAAEQNETQPADDGAGESAAQSGGKEEAQAE